LKLFTAPKNTADGFADQIKLAKKTRTRVANFEDNCHKACRHANKVIIDSRSKYYQDRFVTNADPRDKNKIKSGKQTAWHKPSTVWYKIYWQVAYWFATTVCWQGSRLIRNIPAKSSVMDSIPTSVIKWSVDLFAPLIARLAVHQRYISIAF